MTDWRDRAACLGMWPETWYPHPSDRKTTREAKRICKTCPVRTDCLIDNFDDPHGIYGGTTRLHLYTMLTDFITENL